MVKQDSEFDFTRTSEDIPSFAQIWEVREPEDSERAECLRGTFVLRAAQLLNEYEKGAEAVTKRKNELNTAAGVREADVAEQNLRRAEEKLEPLRIRKDQALMDIVQMFGEEKERFMEEVELKRAKQSAA